MFPYVFAVKKLFRKQELAADRLAVQTMGDPQAAMEVLRKIANSGSIRESTTRTFQVIQPSERG